jgi:hypothetical protein
MLAMFAKEEAVMLPLILSGWVWVLENDERDALRAGSLARLTGPAWVALAIYLALRFQTAAMTPMTATSSYRFVSSPAALAGNAFEYFDRAGTFSIIVLLVAHLLAWRLPSFTPPVRRIVTLGAIWFVGTFSLTIFVPNRSSLYALLPSVAPALVAGFLLQQLWDRAGVSHRRRLVAVAVVLPLLLLPVYWSRNTRWVEIAELSSDTFAVVGRVARERPDVGVLIFRDDRTTRRSFSNAYDELLPVAVRLAAGRDLRTEMETASTEPANAVRIVLKGGKVLVE